MENDTTIKKIKDNILRSTYGKFDFMEELFDRDYLKTEKPRLIYWEILKRLDLTPEDLNRKTFYSWLGRYKKERESKYSTAQQIQNRMTSEKSWRDFEPTNPVPVRDQKKILIKLVSSTNIDGEENN